jgi:hypothetical protein
VPDQNKTKKPVFTGNAPFKSYLAKGYVLEGNHLIKRRPDGTASIILMAVKVLYSGKV